MGEIVAHCFYSTIFNVVLIPDNFTGNLSESVSVHDDIRLTSLNSFKFFFINDSNIASNCGSGHHVISRDHVDINVRIFSFLNHILHILTDWILKSNHREECLSLLKDSNLFITVDFSYNICLNLLEFTD